MEKQATTLFQSLKIQLRVIYALLMREVLTRYGRDNIGLFWLLAEPMMFTLGVTTLWTFSKSSHVPAGMGMPIIPFALTGYSCVLLWRNMASRCCGAVSASLALLYHRNVRVVDVFASRILLEIIGTTASFIVLILTCCFLELMPFPQDPLKILLGWFLLAWFGGSLAFLIGSLSMRTELIERIWHPITYLMFPFSGACFMVDWLPSSAQKALLYLPMVHGTEMVRDGYMGSLIRTHYDPAYMAFCCLVITFLGFTQERIASRQVTLQ